MFFCLEKTVFRVFQNVSDEWIFDLIKRNILVFQPNSINYNLADSRIVYCVTRKKKFILRVWSSMPEQSEGNNHTSKINVSRVAHDFFFYLKVRKWTSLSRRGKKSTLWPASRKNIFLGSSHFFPLEVECVSWIGGPCVIEVIVIGNRSNWFPILSCCENAGARLEINWGRGSVIVVTGNRLKKIEIGRPNSTHSLRSFHVILKCAYLVSAYMYTFLHCTIQ